MQVRLRVTVPATKTDATPPATPDAPNIFWQGEAVLISWTPVGGDLWGTLVEKAPAAGGPYVAIGGLVQKNKLCDAGVVSGQQYAYRLIAEDLSGNQSTASAEVLITIP